MLLRGPEPGQQQRVPGREVILPRHERRWRRVDRRDHGVDARRHRGRDFTGQQECLRALVEAPEKQPDLHDRVDLVQPELERADHAEVAPAATDRPEQLGVLLGGRPPQPAVGRSHLGGGQVVDAQPELAAQPSHAAAQGEPSDAGVADQPGRDGQTVGLSRGVQVGEQGPAADLGALRRRVHGHRVEQAQVDHQAAIAHGRARRVVGAAAHGYLQVMLLRVADGRGRVGGRRAAGDRGRAAIDARVPHPAPVVKSCVVRREDGPVHHAPERADALADRLPHW